MVDHGMTSDSEAVSERGIAPVKTGEESRNGQTMIEFTVIAAMLIVSVAIFAVLLYVFKEQGRRVLDLVALDYP